LHLNEDEWQCEWHSILKLASSQPRTSGSSTPNACDSEATGNDHFSGSKTYESLEEIHVLALAHVLKRPIIVVADTVLKVNYFLKVILSTQLIRNCISMNHICFCLTKRGYD